MASELEIKLTTSASCTDQAHAWLAGLANTSGSETLQLGNTYFDTPAGTLNANRIALRVRCLGDSFIQTLKTRGEFVNGAHRRQEWEWPVSGNHLDLSLITGTPVAGMINPGDLKPVFETNFQRRIVMITQGTTIIEAAFDAGEILAGGRSWPLNEIEFEHKAGAASALLPWAARLADEVPVFLNLVSKAEQGYYLAGLYHPVPAVEAGSDLSVNQFLSVLSLSWLTGQSAPVRPDNLVMLGRLAKERGVGESFSAVTGALLNGEKVSVLMAGRQLGQCQLALAGPSAADGISA